MKFGGGAFINRIIPFSAHMHAVRADSSPPGINGKRGIGRMDKTEDVKPKGSRTMCSFRMCSDMMSC